MKPRISVITVCINAEKTLERTIQSVIAQKYDNVEYIIIDGQSSDKTLDIIKQYDSYIDYWVSEKDDGLYDAMNKGLGRATGDYINFLNSDDWFYPNALVEAAFAMERSDADIIYGNAIIVKDGEQVIKIPYPLEAIHWNTPMQHQSVFVRRLAGLHFNTHYKIAADYDMLLNLFLAGRKFLYIPSTIVYFSHGGVSSNEYSCVKEFTEIAIKGLLKNKSDIALYSHIVMKMYMKNELLKARENGVFEDIVLNYIDSRIIKRNAIIFGTGEIVDKYWNLLVKSQCRVKFFVDNNTSKWGKEKEGYIIDNPDMLKHEKNISVLIMSSKYGDEMLSQLKDMRLDESIDVFDYKSLELEIRGVMKKHFIEYGKEHIGYFKEWIDYLYDNELENVL